MNEYVWTAFLFNKAITLLLTKPFYAAFCQSPDLLLSVSVMVPSLLSLLRHKETNILLSEAKPQTQPDRNAG
jgi:hypothetical protein